MLDTNGFIDLNHVQSPAELRADLRRRIAQTDSAIAEIRTQLATADMKRQARRGHGDPDWVHKARTALRHLRRERSELLDLLAQLPRPKDSLKDRIIELVRADYDDDAWEAVLERARGGGPELH